MIEAHVEAHAAARMRLDNLNAVTLYVNNRPCPGRFGCDALLPPHARLTVYGPGEFLDGKVYCGLPLEER